MGKLNKTRRRFAVGFMASRSRGYANTWDGVLQAARAAGAKYPELVAAQWALESGWGKETSGKHNYFGLKGAGTSTNTQEFVNGEFVTVRDSFLDFESLGNCVNYLVERWYKDWKSHKGVNHATNREDAAKLLVVEGYATDPQYAHKLIKLMNEKASTNAQSHSETQESKPATMQIETRQETALKKKPEQASDLGENDVLHVPAGQKYGVAELVEVPADSHAQVVLAHGAGTWFIWQPHWRVVGDTKAEAAPEIDWNDFNALVTKNLTVGEVLQWDKRRTPPSGSADRARIVKTAQEFQKIRDAWGRPLGVTSFYRPEPINAQVGGVRGSRHVSGEAFDVYPSDKPLDSFYQWIRVRWTGGLGDGRPRGFVHLDTRSGGRFVPGGGATPYAQWLY